MFLLDVDNTLLDNDRFVADLGERLEQSFGVCERARFWEIYAKLRDECGYADYLAALQMFRVGLDQDPDLLQMSRFLLEYPFAERLYPQALEVIAHLRVLGRPVVLSDGDVIFQPRKIQRSGLFDAVDRHVLIYIHKERELDDVERRYPADHYVVVDDKLRILTAVKKVWGERVTTVFPRQGHYAYAPDVATLPPADVTIDRIGRLLRYDLAALLAAARNREGA